MATFHHPASLNPRQRYTQACSILRNTTRASNPAWYQEALQLPLQLHIRTDGAGIVTFYHDLRSSQWVSGPLLNEEILQSPTRLDTMIAEAVSYAQKNGATSLGVILHIADEFATTELKPELDNPASLPELRTTAINDPVSILEDSSVQPDQGSWRVIPYPAARSAVIGTAISLSKQHAAFFETLRLTAEASNFPIITHALSAPLVTLFGLGHAIQPTPDKPFVVVLQYPWFVTMGFFNEYADLRFIRTLQHRGLRRPTNFRNALATTNASLEFVEPDLFLLPLGSAVDSTLVADLQITFPGSRVEEISLDHPDIIPSWCADIPLSVRSENGGAPGITSHTFTSLRTERWALQDFLPISSEVAQIYPSRNEIQLLRTLRLARVAVFALGLAGVAYLGYGMYSLIRKPEWGFSSVQADAAKGRLKMLSIEKLKAEHWGNLLEDRSKASTAMESLSRMFPADSGLLVKTYNHTVKTEGSAMQTKIGFTKEWKITGLALEESLEYLQQLNSRSGIASHFDEIARLTGNPAFNTTLGSRDLMVSVSSKENTSYKPKTSGPSAQTENNSYPYEFTITFTQSFGVNDPLALLTTKAP